MKKDIYSNISNSDALESIFESISFFSSNSKRMDCTTACYVSNLEPNDIDSPQKLLISKAYW